MDFSRQEFWSGLPFPSSGNLSDPGLEPTRPALQADSSPSEPPGLERNQERAGRERDVTQRGRSHMRAGLGHGLEAARLCVSDQRPRPLASAAEGKAAAIGFQRMRPLEKRHLLIIKLHRGMDPDSVDSP